MDFELTIEDILAVRELSLEAKEGQSIVSVLVGRPKRFPDETGYYCPYQIRGAGSERVKYAAGIDSVQAVQLVMQMIGADLCWLQKQRGGRLRWIDSSDLGFPDAT